MTPDPKIPEFKNDREAADFWATHDSSAYTSELDEVSVRVPSGLRSRVMKHREGGIFHAREGSTTFETHGRQGFVLRIAPSGVDRVKEALRDDVIIIGWSEARGLTNPDLTWEQFRQIVHDAYYSTEPNFIRAGSAAGQLGRFIREMKLGDWVVVPHGAGFYVAEVAGDAHYDEPKVAEDTAHRRKVTWLNNRSPILRRLARAALQSRLKIQQSCVGATDLLDEIKDVLENAARGKVLSFEADLRQKLVDEARREIVSGRINERGFEELVASILQSLGGSAVRIVARRLDKGADILATFTIASTFKVLLAVQAKHYKPQRPCGVEAIDELVRGMDAEGAHLGWVVTSGSYSPEALEHARQLQERGIRIELVDGEQLAVMIVEGGLRLGEARRITDLS